MTQTRSSTRNPRSRNVLEEARRHLKKRGLAKQTHRDRHGRICVFQAIEEARVSLGYQHGDDVMNASAAAMEECERRKGGRLDAWNDALSTTLDQALDLLDAAAKTL